MIPLSLTAPVGLGLDNDEDDVKAMATKLSWLGYPEASSAADTGRWNDSIEEGLRQYQRESGLTVDGWAGPGGETEQALNGEFPRASREPDRESAGGTGTFVRQLDGLSPGGFERQQPGSGLLDLEPGRRANPFAAARAFFARKGADDPLFARNSVTGAPLRLPPLAPAPREDSPPSGLSLEDVERILTGRGYRYRPDPMGRIGKGDWLDVNGSPLGDDEKERLVRDWRNPEAEPGGDEPPNNERRDEVTIEIDDGDEARADHAEGEVGVEPANALDRILQSIFGRGTRPTWIRGGKLPPQVKKRVDQIRNERTRRAVEALLDGSDDETLNPKHDHSAIKRTGKYGAHFDFERYVHRAGGTMRDTKPTYDRQTGKKNGRRYTTEDGVNVILRFKGKDESTHIEIQVPRGRDLQRIKLRYRVREFIRGKK